MKRDFLDYLEDIATAVSDALIFAEGMNYDEFVKDTKIFMPLSELWKLLVKRLNSFPNPLKRSILIFPGKKWQG